MQHVASEIEKPHTVEAFAALIGYHPESVRRAIRQGRIRALKFGKDWRIPSSEVRRILENGLPYPSSAVAAPQA